MLNCEGIKTRYNEIDKNRKLLAELQVIKEGYERKKNNLINGCNHDVIVLLFDYPTKVCDMVYSVCLACGSRLCIEYSHGRYYLNKNGAYYMISDPIFNESGKIVLDLRKDILSNYNVNTQPCLVIDDLNELIIKLKSKFISLINHGVNYEKLIKKELYEEAKKIISDDKKIKMLKN